MSAIAVIRSALAGLSSRLPWNVAAKRPDGARMIADVSDWNDALLVQSMVNSAPEWVALYDVAKTIHTRSILGFTYIRVAERKALAAALGKLES